MKSIFLVFTRACSRKLSKRQIGFRHNLRWCIESSNRLTFLLPLGIRQYVEGWSSMNMVDGLIYSDQLAPPLRSDIQHGRSLFRWFLLRGEVNPGELGVGMPILLPEYAISSCFLVNVLSLLRVCCFVRVRSWFCVPRDFWVAIILPILKQARQQKLDSLEIVLGIVGSWAPYVFSLIHACYTVTVVTSGIVSLLNGALYLTLDMEWWIVDRPRWLLA